MIKRVLTEKGTIIDALIKKAKAGDVQALRGINDRLRGKPLQQVWLDDDVISALTIEWLSE